MKRKTAVITISVLSTLLFIAIICLIFSVYWWRPVYLKYDEGKVESIAFQSYAVIDEEYGIITEKIFYADVDSIEFNYAINSLENIKFYRTYECKCKGIKQVVITYKDKSYDVIDGVRVLKYDKDSKLKKKYNYFVEQVVFNNFYENALYYTIRLIDLKS